MYSKKQYQSIINDKVNDIFNDYIKSNYYERNFNRLCSCFDYKLSKLDSDILKTGSYKNKTFVYLSDYLFNSELCRNYDIETYSVISSMLDDKLIEQYCIDLENKGYVFYYDRFYDYNRFIVYPSISVKPNKIFFLVSSFVEHILGGLTNTIRIINVILMVIALGLILYNFLGGLNFDF